jgi:hypothetical protein
MSELSSTLKALLRDVVLFSEQASGLRLRTYQQAVARAIVDSVIQRRGDTIVVIFPRQSGKNELQAQVETYLLTLFSQTEAEMVKVSPTWKPQSLNAMRRLERVLQRNLFTRNRWKKESGYIYRVGKARIFFLSGAMESNIVGATASTLLEVDEAQDVSLAKFDKDIAPMAASTNATRVFWGTAWTAQTLLAREWRLALEAEKADGRRRVFVTTADQVAQEVAAYGRFVSEQIAKLGRNHPLVRSQFFSEEIEAQGGMFPPQRLALIQGSHPRRHAPEAGKVYALLIDVAGEDEAAGQAVEPQPRRASSRDATALTVVEVDLSSLADDLLRAPTYRVADRRAWVGVRHSSLYGQIKALAEHWQARYLVIDASGVGAGLASFLEKALPGRVIPFVFNAATKSRLGWNFLAIIESGRFKDYATSDPERLAFQRELAYCQMEALPGAEHRLRWGVPEGAREMGTAEPIHDDWVLSAALCAVLDAQPWSLPSPTLVVPAADPLKDMDKERF